MIMKRQIEEGGGGGGGCSLSTYLSPSFVPPLNMEGRDKQYCSEMILRALNAACLPGSVDACTQVRTYRVVYAFICT